MRAYTLLLRRIAFALALVATIVVTAGSLAGHQPDRLVSTASQESGGPGPRSVTAPADPGASEAVPSGPRTLPNQYGEDIPVGVQGFPPVPFAGAGRPTSNTTTRMHIMRNGQLWTVQVSTAPTASGLSTAPNADDIINSQLPVMWRCSDEVQSGCWSLPGDPPGNPQIPDRPSP